MSVRDGEDALDRLIAKTQEIAEEMHSRNIAALDAFLEEHPGNEQITTYRAKMIEAFERRPKYIPVRPESSGLSGEAVEASGIPAERGAAVDR